ncbi:MAG: 3-phosphoshikimate 1-carboxyvinyltransferase [Armatimonadetes bacterium CG2_30_59_28]|nr:3-phosphoshikimate 1-carboxyvinyltransferase [Armatimonadota bacterium]OIO89553.1 MAG: 3-phosphoshikimate 1-carboxyvinyltransferase [Armatimonadetes bacterium CG2_30_59_28]PIU60290.1 MAG: 3-phosphoshikimate 1-carboxyvinyltransferase [Armatimonadetes bacterium CG07_land_8_20_14_0_80_59_28]PIX45742.1 MAG: 3-phosphoshikimate 1-carboxyvinyltransferase [Armatimonadetes bacterium CG_4_8_14_3_um_filter_58_9]PIY49375.1 MAG: 3-phosphoshikimate 1-carboxyvinyltransferase [Armatimonadetes bacterium CG_4
MQLTVHRTTRVVGDIHLPGDKSISHRAAMLASLAKGETRIEGYLAAQDCLNTLKCLQQLGVAVSREDTTVAVIGAGLHSYRKSDGVLNVGNSGTTMRLLLGLLAAQEFEVTLDGDASLRKRPMDRIATPLHQMGATLTGQTERCLPPVILYGSRLRPICYRMPVASAQVKSAVLLAGLHTEGQTTVIEPAASRDHTERMLRYLGATVLQEGNRISVIGPADLRPKDLRVPGDISSAAFFIVAAAMCPGSELAVRGVLLNPSRAAYLGVLRAMGAAIAVENPREECGEPVGDVIVRGGALRGTTIQGDIIPLVIDEIPILSVAAAVAEGETTIADASELRVKESDRIATITSGLRQLGAQVRETEDGMVIAGCRQLKGATCASHGDHRVAMSLAIAGLVAEGETAIQGVECIATSFPEFQGLLESVT